MDLSELVVIVVCPTCLVGAPTCSRCNGSGYVFKEPYDTRTGGEQRDDFADVPGVAHGG